MEALTCCVDETTDKAVAMVVKPPAQNTYLHVH